MNGNMFKLSKDLKINDFRFFLTFVVIVIGVMMLAMATLSYVSAANEIDINSFTDGGIKNATRLNDVVNLADGLYYGEDNTKITIFNGDSRTIASKNRGGAVIDGENTNWIFSVQDKASLTLINLTITNARALNNGAVINKQGAGVITLINCTFNHNVAFSGNGGVIYTNGLSGTTANNQIQYIITNCSFTSNSANSGGVIYNSGGSSYSQNKITFDISNSIFSNNNAFSSAVGAGGGFVYNYGGYSGSFNEITFNIVNSTFDSNIATTRGGAVYNYGSADFSANTIRFNAYNSTFTNNGANSGYGGTIYNFDGGNGSSRVDNTIKSCIFSGNFVKNGNSKGFGSVIYSNANHGYAAINIEYSVFSLNTGGIDVYNSGMSAKTVANNNWWGSNDVSGKIYNVTVSSYFIVKLTSSSPNFSQSIGNSLTCTYSLVLNSGARISTANLPDYILTINYNGKNVASFNIKYDYSVSVINNNVQNVFYIANSDKNPSLTLYNKKANVNIVLNSISTVYGGTVSLIATLRDSNGKPIAGRDVSFFVSGKGIRIVKTNSNGVAICPYTATDFAGVKSWNVAFSGDNFYSGSSKAGSISVAKAKTSLVITKFVGKYNKKGSFYAKLVNKNTKKIIARKYVSFYSNGKLLTKVMTNAKGIAKLTVTFRYKGPVTIMVKYVADSTCFGSKKSAKKRIA